MLPTWIRSPSDAVYLRQQHWEMGNICLFIQFSYSIWRFDSLKEEEKIYLAQISEDGRDIKVGKTRWVVAFLKSCNAFPPPKDEFKEIL